MGGAGECTTDTVTRAVMDEAVLQQAIMGVMKNDVFVQLIRDQVKEQVATAVAEAVASRDAADRVPEGGAVGDQGPAELPRAVLQTTLPGRERDPRDGKRGHRSPDHGSRQAGRRRDR